MTVPGEPVERSGEDRTHALVVGLRDRDPNAASLLHKLYRDALLRFCWGYLGSVEEAEDAVQEIFFKVVGASQVPESFRPWVYKIARNHCLNALRARAVRKDGLAMPAASQVEEALTGHLTRLAKDEIGSRLVELVASLPETHREVLRLRYVEELPRREIAEVLDISESVVKSRIFEGLRRLRKEAAGFVES